MEEQTAPPTPGSVIHWATGYDLLAWLLTRGRERELRERIIRLARLEDGNAVLDVGCGTGTLAIAVTRHVGTGGRVWGIDASPSMIARANSKTAKAHAHATFQVAVAEDLPFPDGRFDVVFSTLMLHHLPKSIRQKSAKEINRVLKTGGRALAVDFGHRNRRRFLAHVHRHGHVEVEEIARLFADAGLTPIQTGSIGMNDLNFVLAQRQIVARPIN